MLRNVPRCSMFRVLSTPVFFGVLSLLSFRKQNRSCMVQILMLEKCSFFTRYVFSGIYTMEMVMKILSRGFIFHNHAYLRDGWNWLDFIVVLLGYGIFNSRYNEQRVP